MNGRHDVKYKSYAIFEALSLIGKYKEGITESSLERETKGEVS
jgi:hypothetical protein